MLFRRRKKSKKPGIFKRFVRSLFSIVILTAFVIGIAFATKQLATMDSDNLNAFAGPLLVKIGLQEDVAGEVAGEFVERVSQTGINKSIKVDSTNDISSKTRDSGSTNSIDGDIIASATVKPVATIALLADAHEDWDHLNKGLSEAADLEVDHVFYLGDLSDWGDIPSLEKGRELLEDSGVSWSVLPGDHDLAQSASKNGGNGLENFLVVFENNYGIEEINDITFMYFDNSANFTPLDETRFSWFLNNIDYVDYVILSQPIYHETSNLLMGMVDGEENVDVTNQRKIMLSKIRNSNVNVVFSADHHQSSVTIDPENESIKHIVVGALAKRRNIQTPRFMVLSIFEDSKYEIEEIIL